jgi:two-component system, NtrC family, sensor kinase
MVHEGRPIGVVSVSRETPGPFSDRQIDLLCTFAAQAVIAIENVRLFRELKDKNRALTEAHAQVSESLEQQTATAEILSVISGSPTDIRPVFDAVLDCALTLCEASNGSLYQLEDGALRHVGLRGPPLGIEVGGVLPLASSPGRAVLEKRTVHLEDILQELDWHAPELAQAPQEGVDERVLGLGADHFGGRRSRAEDPDSMDLARGLAERGAQTPQEFQGRSCR